MKKFFLVVAILLCASFMWAKQYTYLSTTYIRLTRNGKLREAEAKCKELIAAGYRIVSVNTDEDSILIIYEDDK